MVLIGIIGNIGSGKSTVSDYLEKKYNFIQKSFADPLKQACQKLFLLSDNQINGTQIEKETPDPRWFNCTPRKMFQFVGTDLFRNQLDTIIPGLGINVFTHHFKLWYDTVKDSGVNVVVSDVRFQNEMEHIKNLGGYLIRIIRPDININLVHQSESELQGLTYDYLIVNDKSIVHLVEQIDNILESMDIKK